MIVTIKKKKIELRYTLRAMMMFENVASKTFSPEGITDIMTFFYCIVLCSGKDYSLSFDDFIDYLDDNPEKLTEFSEWLTQVITNENYLKKN
jgi:hypothetical protein